MNPHKELIEKVRDRYETDPNVRAEFEKVATPIILRFIDRDKRRDLIKDDLEVAKSVIKTAVKFISSNEIYGSLEAILYRPTRWAIAGELRKSKNVHFDEFDDGRHRTNSANVEDKIIIEQDKLFYLAAFQTCFRKLSSKQQEVIKLWKQFGKWSKVAEYLGESRANIAQVKKRAFSNLRECINGLREVHNFS